MSITVEIKCPQHPKATGRFPHTCALCQHLANLKKQLRSRWDLRREGARIRQHPVIQFVGLRTRVTVPAKRRR